MENKITTDANRKAHKTAHQKAQEKIKASEGASPTMTPSSAEVSFDAPEDKNLDQYEKYASNDGTLVLSKLDDKTSVKPGNVMENQARHPAHQQHELAFEEDAPGFEQSGSLYTARHSVHYDQGGSVAEVAAGSAFGQT